MSAPLSRPAALTDLEIAEQLQLRAARLTGLRHAQKRDPEHRSVRNALRDEREATEQLLTEALTSGALARWAGFAQSAG